MFSGLLPAPHVSTACDMGFMHPLIRSLMADQPFMLKDDEARWLAAFEVASIRKTLSETRVREVLIETQSCLKNFLDSFIPAPFAIIV